MIGELGVDQITVGGRCGTVGEAGCWVDEERGPNHDEDVRGLGDAHRRFHHRDGFAEPDDMGAELAATLAGITEEDVFALKGVEE